MSALMYTITLGWFLVDFYLFYVKHGTLCYCTVLYSSVLRKGNSRMNGRYLWDTYVQRLPFLASGARKHLCGALLQKSRA